MYPVESPELFISTKQFAGVEKRLTEIIKVLLYGGDAEVVDGKLSIHHETCKKALTPVEGAQDILDTARSL